MHRHQNIGSKLQRAAGPRKALIRGQLTSLALHEAITTTLPKAKEVAPSFERLVTYAKKGTLASQRQLRRHLLTENATQKMLQELLPAFEGRQGGYTRIIKLANRLGDNAPMARLELVLNEVKTAPKTTVSVKAAAKPKAPAAKPKADKADKPLAAAATTTEAPNA